MKKLLLTFAFLATSLFAEGLFVGIDTGASIVSSKAEGLTDKVPYSIKSTGYSQTLTGKVGYTHPAGNSYAYLTAEKFYDVSKLDNGIAGSAGIGFHRFIVDSYFIGGFVGVGIKDFNSGKDRFIEYGLKAGKTVKLSNSSDLEIGIQCKLQQYTATIRTEFVNPSKPELGTVITDSRSIDNVNLGVYIGINFTGL